MAKWIFLVFFGAIGSLVTVLVFHLGVFKSVHVERTETPRWTLVYRDHQGPYHRINDVIAKVEKDLEALQAPCAKTFGEYIDDPREVEEGRLRSRGGCLFETPPQLPKELPADLQIRIEDPTTSYHAEFSGSPAIGPYKVYSRVFKLAEDERMKLKPEVLEVYTVTGKDSLQTDYYFRIIH